jgi:hypothetical protein
VDSAGRAQAMVWMTIPAYGQAGSALTLVWTWVRLSALSYL